MRVGILALLHESNTFVRPATTIDNFRGNLLVTGEEIRRQLAGTHHEVGGFFAGLDEAGIEAVPIFAARAIPSGTVTAEAFEDLVSRLLAALCEAGPVDGLLVAPHGATVCDAFPDADGEWLTRVRGVVGKSVPIIGTLDAHANLSPMMVDATDALIAYRTNPHLDQRDRGIEAAALMARTMRGEVRPVQSASFPPMVINIERQLTSEPHLVPLYRHADEIRRRPGVLSVSILLGFPYADVAEMGSSCVVVTDGDPAAARALSDELGRDLWDRREDFVGQFTSPEEAIAEVQKHADAGPFCLLDMGDNVGGGSPADGTILARHLLTSGLRSFACIYDPATVERALSLGVGQSGLFEIGGKTDELHGAPLRETFVVRSRHEGTYLEPLPRHGGIRSYDQGATVVLEHAGGLTLLVNSRRTPPFSLEQLRSCGLDPASFQVLAAKGVNAPVAAYAEVCPQMIRVNTPGCTTADIRQLTFHHRRRPLFPLEAAAW